MSASTASTASTDDLERTGLLKAFTSLSLIKLPSLSSRRKKGKHDPPPLPPKVPIQRTEQVSLPPYLAHLNEHSAPQPQAASFPRPQHQQTSAYDLDGGYQVRPPLPQPSSFTAQRPAHETHAAHPSSLVPAAIPLGSAQKPSFPWELVPQAKPSHDGFVEPASSSAGPHRGNGKEKAASAHILELTSSASSSSWLDSLQGSVTPPRSSSAGLHDAATHTPSGAQTNPRQSPVKGQCWGIKKDGDRCSRMQGKGAVSPSPKSRQRPGNSRGASAPVRLGKGTSAMDPFVLDDSDDDGGTSASPTRQKGRAHSSPPSNTAKLADTPAAEDADEWYCHTHISEVNKTVGFYVRRPNSQTLGQNPSDRYITYSDWFQTVSLSNQTQAFLRKCMAQPPSDKDRDEGYLYVYELRDRSTTSHLCLKVGRTKHVFRRHGEWRSQCHSEPHLLWFCPSTENQGLHPGLHPTEVPGVPLSHRWETLVHLELSSIGERTKEICHNCGARHREIFMIPRSVRSTGSQLDGFDLTQRVIGKWMRFVQLLT